MAWPPPVLPINRTNATPQLDNHPQDHNVVNQAVNDTVAQVQTLTAYTGQINTKVDNLAVVVSDMLRGTTATGGGGAGSVTTSESSPGTINLSAGLWIIGYTLNVNTAAAGGWGFLSAGIKYQNGTTAVPAMIPLSMYEGEANRSDPSGLCLVNILAATDVVHLRASTFATSLHIDGCTIRAHYLRPLPAS